jgi:hypothetical protein
MIQERETELFRFTIEKRGPWYHVNAWGRTSKHAVWQKVWIEHVHISYLAALNEYNDTGALVYAWKNQQSPIQFAA